MHPLDNTSIATTAWAIGTLAGLVFALALVASIASTPRLREHAGRPDPIGLIERRVAGLAPVLCVAIWIAGAVYVGRAAIVRYTLYSGIAAALLLAVIILPMTATAARHIARRSIR
ncbi:MAG: hypothetical protein ACREUG_07265 [Steroidobacteraceae bacterium]